MFKKWWEKMIAVVILVIIACVLQHYFMKSDFYELKMKPTYQREVKQIIEDLSKK